MNRYLRSWVEHYRYGNSTRAFEKIRGYALLRMALFVAKLHKKRRRFGWAMVLSSPDALGLISLDGLVVAPRPNRPWRAKPNAPGKGSR